MRSEKPISVSERNRKYNNEMNNLQEAARHGANAMMVSLSMNAVMRWFETVPVKPHYRIKDGKIEIEVR